MQGFLRHSVSLFILVEHLRMVLLFYLDISKQLSQIALTTDKYISIVLAGNQLLCSDTVRCEETVMFLVLGIAHCGIRCLRLIIASVAVITVTGRHSSFQYLSKRIIVLLFLFLKGLKETLELRVLRLLCIFSVFLHTALFLCLQILNGCPFFFL